MTALPRSQPLARGLTMEAAPPLDQRPAMELVPARVSKASALSRKDLDWMGLGLLLTLLVSYVLSYHRIFWEDEMLGWMLLRDPSWHHMISAWKMGADGGGFAFYLTGRLWFALFGPSDLSFRFYSAVCFGLAFCVLWITQRRFYGRRIIAFALFNTWFFSPPLVTTWRKAASMVCSC